MIRDVRYYVMRDGEDIGWYGEFDSADRAVLKYERQDIDAGEYIWNRYAIEAREEYIREGAWN